MLSEDHDKTRDSPVTFVTHERFAVLFFLRSFWVHPLLTKTNKKWPWAGKM